MDLVLYYCTICGSIEAGTVQQTIGRTYIVQVEIPSARRRFGTQPVEICHTRPISERAAKLLFSTLKS